MRNKTMVAQLKKYKDKDFFYGNNDINAFNAENSVVIFERFNWGQAEKSVLETKDIIKNRHIEKRYSALVHGEPKKKHDLLKNYLLNNRSTYIRFLFNKEAILINPLRRFCIFAITGYAFM